MSPWLKAALIWFAVGFVGVAATVILLWHYLGS